jgi:hypothetical protein
MTTTTHTINTHVTFAAASHPYVHVYAAGTTAAQVLSDALTAFDITTDGTTRYYLLFNGAEVAGSATLESLVTEEQGHEHQITLALRTETISGAI